MPLIVLSGFPCCGKTTFANRLRERLLNEDTTVLSSELIDKRLLIDDDILLINEESERISKSQGYASSLQEKSTRGILRSAVTQKLSKDKIIIADSLNYIKGFRYELYCSSRSFRTPHCVVWVDCDEQLSNSWNSSREDSYNTKIMEDLRLRFEAPNEKNRWDFPLFRVNMTPATFRTDNAISSSTLPIESNLEIQEHSVKSSWKPRSKKSSDGFSVISKPSTDITVNSKATNQITFSGSIVKTTTDNFSDDSNVDDIISQIVSYLKTAIAPNPNASTLQIFHANSDLLYELDDISKKITDIIVNQQNASGCADGTPIILHEYNRSITFHRIVSSSELQRLRRQFVKINSQHPPSTIQEIGASFVDYLSAHI